MRKVEASIVIHQPALKVFDAFIEPRHLRKWWSAERCLIENRQGGIYSLAWKISKHGFQYISTGVITVYHPGRELMIDHFVHFNPERSILGPTYLSLRMNEKDSSTDLQLVQGGYQSGYDWDWFYDSVRDAWPKVLLDLRKYLENP